MVRHRKLPDLEPLALDRLLADVTALYPSVDESLRVEARGGAGLLVRANREAMTKVLTNLVENALQAMGQRGRVELVAERDGDRARIRVLDEGPGIEPEVADRLFEAYFSTKSYGTGLGLLICRNLTEKMGGRIHLHNRPDRSGAEAVVELPLAGDLAGTPGPS